MIKKLFQNKKGKVAVRNLCLSLCLLALSVMALGSETMAAANQPPFYIPASNNSSSNLQSVYLYENGDSKYYYSMAGEGSNGYGGYQRLFYSGMVDNGTQFNNIADAINNVANKLSNTGTSGGGSTAPTSVNVTVTQNQEAPILTVVAGKNFNLACNKYDDMLSGSSGGVTVTNSTVGDGAILVSGKLNTSGNYTIQINGKTFIFNVITEPSSSNVAVLLN